MDLLIFLKLFFLPHHSFDTLENYDAAIKCCIRFSTTLRSNVRKCDFFGNFVFEPCHKCRSRSLKFRLFPPCDELFEWILGAWCASNLK
jgi:hypothetical protein